MDLVINQSNYALCAEKVKEIFLDDTDLYGYLYEFSDIVEQIRQYDAKTMINDLKYFIAHEEPDMVAFYFNEIKSKFANDEMVIMFLESIKKDYISSIISELVRGQIKNIQYRHDTGKYFEKFSDDEKSIILGLLCSQKCKSEFGKDFVDTTNMEYFPTSCFGFVYAIFDKDKGCVKIGKSKQPETRIKNIINISGIKNFDVFVSDFTYDYGNVELSLHRYFSESLQKSEWFSINFEDARLAINSMASKSNSSIKGDVRLSDLIESYNDAVRYSNIAPLFEAKAVWYGLL